MAYPINPIYKLLRNPEGVVDCVMKRTGSSEPYNLSTIPFVEDNTGYQEYLAWVAEGNTAEAAD